jgi:alkylhydroperoxidase/carboxymuconolactone decarboxylase family protein YurZ
MAVRSPPSVFKEMRPMDATVIDENIDRRLNTLEPILPTLATTEELQTLATKVELEAVVAPLATRGELRAAIAPLATKEELRAAIAPLATTEELRVAIAPLATKEELRATIAPLATKEELRATIAPLATKDDVHDLRRQMHILSEDQRADTRLLAEHLAIVMSRLPER